MSSAAEGVLSVHRLRRRVLSLGSAKAFDYAMQFLLPVILVRTLDTTAFGHYRLLWVAVGTVVALAPLGLPGCLYYFLPRMDAAKKRLYINQTVLFLCCTGLIGAWAVSPWNPWLPEKMSGLAEFGGLVPAFVMLWVVSSLLDLLPTIEEHIAWQAKVTIGLGALRAAALSAAAFLTGDLGVVLWVLLGFVGFKLALLIAYIAGRHGLKGPIMQRDVFADQIKHAAPFGAAGGVHDLRSQSDQWVAAALFPIGLFAAFSIATVLSPLVNLFRQSVNHVFLPGMSRLQSEGNLRGMLELNSRANVMVGSIVFPILAFAFVYAEEIVTVVYTDKYLAGAPVMRTYIAGMAPLVVELASVVLLLRLGTFMLRLNVVLLALSIVVSWFAAQSFGLAGAAAGFVLASYINCFTMLSRIGRLTRLSLTRLQDWRSLGLLFAFTVAAAAAAWAASSHYLAASGPLLRMAAGGAILAAVYAILNLVFGSARSLLPASQKGKT